MKLPQSDDYIDIHTHNGKDTKGVFFIENLMAHEERTPEDCAEHLCTYGIHPWYINSVNIDQLLKNINAVTGYPNMIAIGEAGYDKIRGVASDLQTTAFEAQIAMSEKAKKPVVIHCVKAWDNLLASRKKLKPLMPWLIHGFRGSVDLAKQLLSKGMYLSFWFDFVIRPESAKLLKALPMDKIFLETDGANIDIRDIYIKVAKDLNIPIDELKLAILENFKTLFEL